MSLEELILSAQQLVRSLAAQVHKKFHCQFELEDLISYGQVGLAAAASDFDPEQGTQFSTFAYYRIRGAIYEGVSKLSGTTRAQYKRMKYEQSAANLLERGPHSNSGWTKTSVQEDAAWFSTLSHQLAGVALLRHCHLGENAESLADEQSDSAEDNLESTEITEQIRSFVEELPEESRLLIQAMYFDGLTLSDAAERLGVSKSWASRLHARTLQSLATALKTIGLSAL
jgi:RNA polymerase sigma factor for flagellar operon FliA